MTKLNMTEQEICKSFIEAKNQREQIRILADLNNCGVDRIKAILKKADLELPRGRIPGSKRTTKSGVSEGLRIELSEEKIQSNIARLAAKEREKQAPVQVAKTEPPYISKPTMPEMPISREVWLTQRAHDLKAWLLVELTALRPIDVELVQEYNEVCQQC